MDLAVNMREKEIDENYSNENARADELFQEQQRRVYRKTDRIFSVFLPLQWLFALGIAWCVLPEIVTPGLFGLSEHLSIALLAGGFVTLVPVFFTVAFPGRTATRYVVAISQMTMSGVLIQITDGRPETHFHVFGSLALLACYRDWKVLIPSTLITIGDHLLRGWLFPESLVGTIDAGRWSWLEHAAWLMFADIFLIFACRQSIAAMMKSAEHNALLEASEQRYRTVIEQMTESIFLVNPETLKVVECNHAFVELLGCDGVDEVKKLTIFDFDRGDQKEIAEMLTLLKEQKKSLTGTRKYQRQDGTVIDVELTGRFIYSNETDVFCVNARDVTDRNKAEIELRRLALVAQKTQNGVVISDPGGRIEWVNEGFTRLTGYLPEDVVGRKPGSVLQGERTSLETVLAIREAIRSRSPFAGEIYNYRKNGQGYWSSIAIMPINNKRGIFKGFVGVQMDITERKEMERKLQTSYDELEQRIVERTAELVKANEQMKAEVSERQRAQAELAAAQQFLRKVIDDIPGLIFVKDIQGKFVLVNRALAKLYGTRPEKMIGKTYGDFHLNPEEIELYRADDLDVINNLSEKIVHEEKLTDADGNVHWLHTVKRPLIGDNGVENILGIATDLTERKIMESQLRHAQKLESIGQLAAGIAHEINTPTQYVGDNTRFVRDSFADLLFVLEKYGELLTEARSGNVSGATLDLVTEAVDKADLEFIIAEVPKAINQTLDGVTRIATIVQSMKDFAHPGTSEMKAADLNKAIESTLTVARNEWKYVADTVTHFDTSLPMVPCLLGEINQVLLNMIINASHAIADVLGDDSGAKGTITISTTRVNDQWAEIRIGDTGTGIPPAVQGKIFDPFFTTKEVGKGTGQGLAISHTVVVEKHHGKLGFETVPGEGTTFIIQLPLAQGKN